MVERFRHCSYIGDEIARIVYDAGVQVYQIVFEDGNLKVETIWPCESYMNYYPKYKLETFVFQNRIFDENNDAGIVAAADIIVKQSIAWDGMPEIQQKGCGTDGR